MQHNTRNQYQSPIRFKRKRQSKKVQFIPLKQTKKDTKYVHNRNKQVKKKH